jgi:uncharacterized protein (DUF433 family)
MRKTLVIGMALVAILALGAVTVLAQGPRGGFMDNFGGRGVRGIDLDTLAEALGLEDDDALLEALQDGQTVAEIAEAQGVALEDVVAALTAEYEADLADAVEDGDITQEVADARLTLFKAELEARLNADFATPFDRFGGMMGGQMMGGMLMGGRFDFGHLDTIAEALGLESDALQEALQDGQTIAEIAEEQGVALEDVTAAVIAAVQTELAAEVEDGDITQAQADAHLAMAQANLEACFNGDMSGFGGMMGDWMRGQMMDGGMMGDWMRGQMMDGGRMRGGRGG